MSLENNLALAGSVGMVTEFLGFAVNSILYQRGVYPPEDFAQVTKYGMPLMVTTNSALKSYLGNSLRQLVEWLANRLVHRVVMVITRQDTNEVLERWAFDIDTAALRQTGPFKSDVAVRAEIEALMRQISTSATFLPVLNQPCLFDLLVFTNTNCTIPRDWELSDPRMLSNSTDVTMRSFSTSFHKVDPVVSFREQQF